MAITLNELLGGVIVFYRSKRRFYVNVMLNKKCRFGHKRRGLPKYKKYSLPKYLKNIIKLEGELNEHELLTQPKFDVEFEGFPNPKSITDILGAAERKYAGILESKERYLSFLFKKYRGLDQKARRSEVLVNAMLKEIKWK